MTETDRLGLCHSFLQISVVRYLGKLLLVLVAICDHGLTTSHRWDHSVAKEVGTYGQLGGQATVEGVSGTWKDLTDNVNVSLASILAIIVRHPLD